MLLLNEYAPSQRVSEIYFGIAIFLRHILPVFITVIATILLVRFIQKNKKRRSSILSEGNLGKRNQNSTNQLDDLTICLTTVAVLFLLLLVPHSLVSITGYTGKNPCSRRIALSVTFCSDILNSSVNFFVYYWKLPPFRRAVRAVCSCSGVTADPPESRSKVYSVSSTKQVSSDWIPEPRQGAEPTF